MTFTPLPLFTGLRASDSLADNESYFFAELKRLQQIVLRLRRGEKLFIILDEILRGTNSVDKQSVRLLLSVSWSGPEQRELSLLMIWLWANLPIVCPEKSAIIVSRQLYKETNLLFLIDCSLV